MWVKWFGRNPGEKDFLQFLQRFCWIATAFAVLRFYQEKRPEKKKRDPNVPPDKNASINRDSRRTGCTERWEVGIPGTSLMISICKTRVESDKELAESRHVDKNYRILQVIYEDSRPESGLWWCRKMGIAAKCLCMEKLQEITVFYWYGGMKLKIEINLIYTK